MENLKINSDYYGEYEAEFLFEIDYRDGIFKAAILQDKYNEIFHGGYMKDVGEWDEGYPEEVTKNLLTPIVRYYFPTEASAPGMPMVDDKGVRKMRKFIEMNNPGCQL